VADELLQHGGRFTLFVARGAHEHHHHHGVGALHGRGVADHALHLGVGLGEDVAGGARREDGAVVVEGLNNGGRCVDGGAGHGRNG
jgi:hypothetical protein